MSSYFREIIAKTHSVPYLSQKAEKREMATLKQNIHYTNVVTSKNIWAYLNLLSQRQILGTGNLPQDSAPVCINIDISPEMAAQSAQQNQEFCEFCEHLIGPQLHQLDLVSKYRCPAEMEVSLPQTMLQKLLDLLKLESFRPHQEIAIQSIIQDQKDAVICTHIYYHNQHESAALIGLFHVTSLVLTSVESYRNYRKPTQRGVQGYLSSLQQRVI